MNSIDSFNFALKKHLEGLVIDDKIVPVIYATPEAEFYVKEKPSIVIMRSGLVLDTSRWTNGSVKVVTEYSDEGTPLTGKYVEYSQPFNLYYTIRAYGKYQQDVTTMIMHILTRLPRVTSLEVGSLQYDIFFESNKGAVISNISTEKQISGDREFVEQLMYKMEVVLDLGRQSKEPEEFKYSQDAVQVTTKKI